jgi:hypothetical protein
MTIAYDPRGMSWDEWCKLTDELFAQQQLGIAPEEQWKDWVNGLAGLANFMDSGVPDSRGFDDWQEWAEQFVGIMNVGQP